MRKLLGILVLVLVAIAGVVYVELTSRTTEREASAEARAGSLYRVVVGGERPARSELTSLTGGLATSSEPMADESDGAGHDLPIAREPEQQPREFRYSVKDGDSLASIAREHLGADSREVLDRIARDNGLKNANALRAGQTLVIRVARCDRHVATGKETARDLARKAYGSQDRVDPLHRANPTLPTADDVRLRAGLVIWIPH